MVPRARPVRRRRTLWLTLTGGEPLLRPDFCDIYAYAHGLGLVLTVYTNATLITERHLELWRTLRRA